MICEKQESFLGILQHDSRCFGKKSMIQEKDTFEVRTKVEECKFGRFIVSFGLLFCFAALGQQRDSTANSFGMREKDDE